MNKECGMVRDLLPLVIDEVASEASREYVEAHLSGCAECTAVYAEMKKEIPAKTEQDKGNEQAAFSKAAGKLKRKKRLRTLRNVLLGVLIGCIVLGGGLIAHDRIAQAREHIYYGLYNVYLSELKSGDVVFTVDYHGSYDDLGTMVRPVKEKDGKTGEEKNILYVYVEKYLINRKLASPMQNYGFMEMTAEELNGYDEIRQGVPSEYRTIWTPGGKIDKASEQMEEYYFWDRIDQQLWHHADETPDGKAGYASYEMTSCWNMVGVIKHEISATVPEWPVRNTDFRSMEPLNLKTIQYVLSVLKENGIEIGTPNPYEDENLPGQE